jgi:hypothetical protein
MSYYGGRWVMNSTSLPSSISLPAGATDWINMDRSETKEFLANTAMHQAAISNNETDQR